MAPSQSTPQQVSNVMKQIIMLIDSVDNKVLLAYYDMIAKKVREHTYSGVFDTEYGIITHLFALKVIIQNERRKNGVVNAR